MGYCLLRLVSHARIRLLDLACGVLHAKLGALGRPGGDLLSHALRRSTIGAEGLYDRVRDGIGCGSLAMTTRSSKRAATSWGQPLVGRATGP